MLVVKRPFKNLGKAYTAGSVIDDPAVIKRLKGKIAEGKIVEVTEQTYGATSEYFKIKFGVDIPELTASSKKDDKVETKAVPKVKPAVTEKVSTAKTKVTN